MSPPEGPQCYLGSSPGSPLSPGVTLRGPCVTCPLPTVSAGCPLVSGSGGGSMGTSLVGDIGVAQGWWHLGNTLGTRDKVGTWREWGHGGWQHFGDMMTFKGDTLGICKGWWHFRDTLGTR